MKKCLTYPVSADDGQASPFRLCQKELTTVVDLPMRLRPLGDEVLLGRLFTMWKREKKSVEKKKVWSCK